MRHDRVYRLRTAPLAAAPSAAAGNEQGFALIFVMFLLATCLVLGMSAMNTGVTESDIAASDVIAKKVFAYSESGLQVAAHAILKTNGRGSWDSGGYLSASDPSQTAPSGAIQVNDGSCLSEGRDLDMEYDTGWNNARKHLYAPDSAHADSYAPIDDPFEGDAAATDTAADLVIRTSGSANIAVDVDKTTVTFLEGGVAEFGAGAEGAAGAAYKVVYVLDSKATLPGRSLASPQSPSVELCMGYRLIPQ